MTKPEESSVDERYAALEERVRVLGAEIEAFRRIQYASNQEAERRIQAVERDTYGRDWSERTPDQQSPRPSGSEQPEKGQAGEPVAYVDERTLALIARYPRTSVSVTMRAQADGDWAVPLYRHPTPVSPAVSPSAEERVRFTEKDADLIDTLIDFGSATITGRCLDAARNLELRLRDYVESQERTDGE